MEVMSLLERRKRLMIWITLAIILVILGTTGIGLLLSNRTTSSIVKSSMSGSSTSEMLEEPPYQMGDFSPDEMEQLQYLMMKTGFGYENEMFLEEEWKAAVEGDPAEALKETDEKGEITNIEKLFMLWNGKKEEDRPEYVENPDNIKIDTKAKQYIASAGANAYLVTAQAEYNGEVYTSDEYIWVLAWPSTGTPPEGSFYSKEEAEKAATTNLREKINAKYKELGGEEWAKWSGERTSWIKGSSSFLVEKERGNEYDSYFAFWAGIAAYIAETSDTVTYHGDEESLRKLNDILHQQVYDENDEEYSEVDNILKEYLENGKYDFKETDPDNPGGGTTDPDNPGGGTTDPDNPGGGTTDPDNPGGEEPGDTEPAKLESIELAEPSNGVYMAGQQIRILVKFDKSIYGTVNRGNITKDNAPKVYIRFVDENNNEEKQGNKQVEFVAESGKILEYTYIIEEGDNGKLELGEGDNIVGSVYNVSGKETKLTKVEKFAEDREIIADTKAPVVETIKGVSEEKSYNTGEEIEIKVTFNEEVYGTQMGVGIIEETAPILNIKFGEGEVKNPTIKNIGKKDLTYSYKIEEEDRGKLMIDEKNAFDGRRAVYDKVGNRVELIEGVKLTGNEITANADKATIKLNKTEVTLDLNGTKEETIEATVEPTETEITWNSTDEKVATVDGTGKVTATGIGETTIVAKAEDGTTAECKVTVKDTTNGETKVTLNKESITLDLGGVREEELKATVTPTQLEVTWSSTDEEIVKVDKEGKVTAVKVGTAEIIAKAKDGTIAKCQVTVTDENRTVIEPEDIKINISNPTVAKDRTTEIELKPELTPSNSNTSTKLTYKSSNEEVATIDENGKITIKEPGTTIITVITENGKIVSTNLNVVDIKDIENKSNLGDINKDGKVDSTDLLIALRYKAVSTSEKTRLKHQDWKMEDISYILGDIDANGTIDTTDILKIQRHLAYLKSEIVKGEHPDWKILNDW